MINKKLTASLVAAASLTTLLALAEDVRIMAKTYNVLSESLPRDTPLRELKLREAGLTAGPHFQQSDEIRIFASSGESDKSPLARIWLNAAQTNAYWFHTGGTNSAEDYIVKKGALIVINARAATTTHFATKPE